MNSRNGDNMGVNHICDISIFRMMSNCLKILLQAVEGVRDVVGEAGDLQHKKDLL